MPTDNLIALEDWAGGLLAGLTPAARRQIAKAVAVALRASQQRRIAQQQDPDGAAYAPRKARPSRLRGKAGRIKRQAMFAKLRRAKYLKATADATTATVAFTGRAGAIAAVHQQGGVDNVGKQGPRVRYPRRILLGFSAEDRELVRNIVLDHLTA